ncbi:MAG: menaquinone biosynthesis protein [Cyanobacteria bacterium NC_groundwater_1444_Ag_S-0.65um_54_12]|nr:menaquinone biosynthesis protein [Cyanobacteria bacterium NC_groundwater_1444_Ag_S-0.65um_54_12]
MLTIGETSYISTLPLYYSLRSQMWPDFQLVPGNLADLITALCQGAIDVGPITLVEYLRQPEKFTMIPGLALSSLGRSGCVLLFSGRPAYELANARIAVPVNATGAVALLRWLLHEMYRFEPTLLETAEQLSELNLREYDAVLLFQDAALLANTDTAELVHVWDLGEAWWQITNTPLIYLMWVARHTLPMTEVVTLSSLFKEAKITAMAKHTAILEEACQRTGLPFALLEGYLGRFNYEFTPAHQEGMELFAQTVGAIALS